ncbi:hypothetical protein [uncultured Methanolobus sp.]|uniref:PHP domain-containing protein n=1 Tax=uncultured Methanolobus sp. TaxID=218300 RepID=UPI0029C98CFB|nr:hypothetical protein [uncultured Methanolobus sp.]
MYTSCSYDVPANKCTNPQNLVKKVISNGLDFVIFTDHDTVKAYELMGWNKEKLIPALELSIKYMENVGHMVHINVFELDRRICRYRAVRAKREGRIQSS